MDSTRSARVIRGALRTITYAIEQGAKIILASTNENAFILDPFAGSGTTAVTAKKLGRQFCAVECDERYCLLAEKRLTLADEDSTIQGFADGIFYERNTQIK